ncbi:MAG: VCBS repeat-containing protein [Bdellovibrionaceae bacterium]|nr:VCBS repeat-containing protein [Pseudobdellovibrionaceae bacterium]
MKSRVLFPIHLAIVLLFAAPAWSDSSPAPDTEDIYTIVERSQVQVNRPAFLTLAPPRAPGRPPTVLISSFGLVGSDHIYRLRDPREALSLGIASFDEITNDVTWPNEVQPLGIDEFGHEGYLISSGFLVPWKATGAVSFLDTSGYVHPLTRNKFQYFYHRAVFVDLTGTGRRDILTARAKVSPAGNDSELVWLKRPKRPLNGPWEEVVLAKGPDMHFRVFKDERSGLLFIATAEFISKKVGLYWIEKDGSVGGRLIDDEIGAGFDVDVQDLNNDGRPELLVTNHESEAAKSGVFAYEMPDDLKTGEWKRHTLVIGIETRQSGIGQASPGAAKVFYPETPRSVNKSLGFWCQETVRRGSICSSLNLKMPAIGVTRKLRSWMRSPPSASL